MAADALRKLGKYEIRGTLGKGAMGIVYDGFDRVIERRVAIKTIAKESMEPREAAELLGRFKREAQAAGRLNHPGIVSIHDYGEDDGLAFIAMEFINGSDLRKYFESQQRFALAQIVRIVCDVLDALDHAHRNGVVHRDIKPANIMITDEGRVKVADFGVAWIESSTMTQVGMRIGTPAYMSPEQHQGLPVSGRSDLFSVGVILYEFLTGERPFIGNGWTIVQQILLKHAIPPSEVNADIPRALDAVTMKALAKRPEDRFANAREFADAFRNAATGESVGAGVDLPLDDGSLPPNGGGTMPLPGSGRGTTASGAPAIAGGSNLSDVSLEAELEYWKEIKDSAEAADFETFLQSFPESRFAPLARRRMNRLEDEAKGRRDADEREQQAIGEQTCVAAVQAVMGAAEGSHRADPDRQRRAAEEHHQREEEKTQLLAEVDSRQTAESFVRKEHSEGACLEVDAREPPQARAHRQRDLDWRLPRLDAEEPKLVLRPGGEANDPMQPVDLSPRVMERPISAAGNPPHFKTVIGPVHARRRAAPPMGTQAVPVTPHRFARSASRKRPRRLFATALVAVLIGGGTWYAARPELAPMVTKVRMEIQAILAQLEQQWRAPETVQTAPEQKGVDAARLAAEQRTSEEALSAERNRQLTLARQKQEAARTAALQNYQRALALLDQGRSSEAVRILRQLANEGHGAAAKTLGDLYSTGEKVLLDRQEAAHFYAIAERNGVKVDGSASIRR